MIASLEETLPAIIPSNKHPTPSMIASHEDTPPPRNDT